MTPPSGSPARESFILTGRLRPSVTEVALPRRVAFMFYALLFVAGILVYLIWGIAYGTWNIFAPPNLGVYAVTVVLLGFGLLGMLLYRD